MNYWLLLGIQTGIAVFGESLIVFTIDDNDEEDDDEEEPVRAPAAVYMWRSEYKSEELFFSCSPLYNFWAWTQVMGFVAITFIHWNISVVVVVCDQAKFLLY